MRSSGVGHVPSSTRGICSSRSSARLVGIRNVNALFANQFGTVDATAMLESASDCQFMRTANTLVERVVHSEPAISKRGCLERLFTASFRGIVYTHVWEDPVVDLAALALGPAHVVLTISSAGCNLLNYLTERPARILSVDVNPHHLALTRLKIAALKHLPSYDAFFSFWGVAADRKNLEAYDT